MRMPRRRHRTLVVGFLQDRKSLAPITKALRADRFLRAATVNSPVERKTVSADWIAFRYLATVVIAISAALPILVGEYILPKLPESRQLAVAVLIIFVWAICAWIAS